MSAVVDLSRPEMLVNNRPWPPHEFVERLVAAADHLLRDHGCDAHGYNSISNAVAAARSWLEDFGDCTTTERHSAYAAFLKICTMVEHDSTVYLIAVEELSALGAAIRSSSKETTVTRAKFAKDVIVKCPFEGNFKAVNPDGRVTKLYCLGHATDWIRQFPDNRLVQPRNVFGDVLPCCGDWPLPGEVP